MTGGIDPPRASEVADLDADGPKGIGVAAPCRHTFLAFLGTGKYEPTVYQRPGAAAFSATPYVQVALLQERLADGAIEGDLEAVLFLTTEARRKHWEAAGALRDALAELQVPARTINIPDGRDEREHWEIFQRIVDAVPEGQSLHIDITHGFRSLPALLVKALDYLRRVKGVTVHHLDYGAFVPSALVAPLVDLRPLLDIDVWAVAYAAFTDNGDLLQLSRTVDRALGSAGRELLPPALNRLPSALRGLGEALAHCRLDAVGPQAARALKALVAARRELHVEVRLSPLVPILVHLEEQLRPLASVAEVDGGALAPLLAAAEYHLRRESYLSGYTFLRELLVSLLGARLTQNGVTVADRRALDHTFGSILGRRREEDPERAGAGPDTSALDLTRYADAAWLRALRVAAQPVAQRRNVFLHAHTGPHVPANGATYGRDAEQHVRLVRAALLTPDYPVIRHVSADAAVTD